MKTKKRPPKHAELANVIRDRLEELRRELRMNYTQFAQAAGVPKSQYDAWRNHGVVPGAFYIRYLALNLGVSADWLLGIEGAPRNRTQVSTAGSLAADVAAHVERGVAAELAQKWPHVGAEVLQVDGDRALRVLVATAAARAKAETTELARFWNAVVNEAFEGNPLRKRIGEILATNHTTRERNRRGAEVFALLSQELARRAHSLFAGSWIRVRPDRLEDFIRPIQAGLAIDLARASLELAGGDSLIYLAFSASRGNRTVKVSNSEGTD